VRVRDAAKGSDAAVGGGGGAAAAASGAVAGGGGGEAERSRPGALYLAKVFYLVLYNTFQFLGWLSILVVLAKHFYDGRGFDSVWADIDLLLIVFQSAAVLEVRDDSAVGGRRRTAADGAVPRRGGVCDNVEYLMREFWACGVSADLACGDRCAWVSAAAVGSAAGAAVTVVVAMGGCRIGEDGRGDDVDPDIFSRSADVGHCSAHSGRAASLAPHDHGPLRPSAEDGTQPSDADSDGVVWHGRWERGR
jgi:hypothetical protein